MGNAESEWLCKRVQTSPVSREMRRAAFRIASLNRQEAQQVDEGLTGEWGRERFKMDDFTDVTLINYSFHVVNAHALKLMKLWIKMYDSHCWFRRKFSPHLSNLNDLPKDLHATLLQYRVMLTYHWRIGVSAVQASDHQLGESVGGKNERNVRRRMKRTSPHPRKRSRLKCQTEVWKFQQNT